MFGSVTFFLGALFLLPAYLKSIEHQMTLEGRFRPFNLFRIFKYCGVVRAVLLAIGLTLWLVAFMIWLKHPIDLPETTRDIRRDVGVIVLIWAVHIYGYCRELEFKKHGSTSPNLQCLNGVTTSEWKGILLKSIKDFIAVALTVWAIFLLKHYIAGA